MAMRVQLGPDSRSFMLATPDLGIPDPDVLAVIEGFVDEHPDVDFQTLSFVPGSTGPFLINDEQVRVTFPPTAGADLTNRVHEIDVVRLHMENTATMLPADDPRPPQWRAELDTLMSTGYRRRRRRRPAGTDGTGVAGDRGRDPAARAVHVHARR